MTLKYTHIIFIAITCHAKTEISKDGPTGLGLEVVKENKNLGVHCSSGLDSY